MNSTPPVQAQARHAHFGEHLRHWRQHRRLSQLELSAQADISTRHLSFVETGRSLPSRAEAGKAARDTTRPRKRL